MGCLGIMLEKKKFSEGWSLLQKANYDAQSKKEMNGRRKKCE
jgi:hypothetical protein